MSRSISRPLPQCAHPDCIRILSKHTAKYCREHFRTSPEFLENYQKGIRSSETRAKMSASAKKRANTPEGRVRMSKAAKSQIVNPFSEQKHTEETRAIIKAKRANQTFSEETRQKISQANTGHTPWNVGVHQTEEAKAKISVTLRSKHEHLSRKAKERIARETPEERDRRLANWIQAGQSGNPRLLNTTIELFVEQYLISRGIEYRTQEQIGYYIVDFYLPVYNLIINVDGCYWHGCTQCGFNSPTHIAKRRSDRNRYHYLARRGYKIKSLWEHDIRKAMHGGAHILHLRLE